jgi:hypothetical protein
LWRRLAIVSTDELRPLVAHTPAQPLLKPENVRVFGSIRSVTTAALVGLEHVARQSQGTPLSIRDYMACRRHSTGTEPGSHPHVVSSNLPGASPAGSVLFMPYAAGQMANLRSLIATWLRLAIFEAMNGAEGDQRLWVVIDESDALGAIDGLKDALGRLRKFGGAPCWDFNPSGK